MVYSHKAILAVIACSALLSSPVYAGLSFGEHVAANAIGTGIGSTIGTALGNAISKPSRSSCPVEEVHIRKVYPRREVYVTEPRRLSRLERQERKLQAELDELYARRAALERRQREIEREIVDIDNTLSVTKDSLHSVQSKLSELGRPVVVTKGDHIGSIVVE